MDLLREQGYDCIESTIKIVLAQWIKRSEK